MQALLAAHDEDYVAQAWEQQQEGNANSTHRSQVPLCLEHRDTQLQTKMVLSR